MKEALGLIEAVGLNAAVEAADVCLKSANVRLIGYELSKGGGYVTVKILGDVGAVNAAVAAAVAAASKVRGVYGSRVIPRPSEGVWGLVDSKETVGRPVDPVKSVPETVAPVIGEMPADAVDAGPSEDADPFGSAPQEAPEEETPEGGSEGLEPEAALEGSPDPGRPEASEEATTAGFTCNICMNPACGRQKGDPRSKCIKYRK